MQRIGRDSSRASLTRSCAAARRRGRAADPADLHRHFAPPRLDRPSCR